MPSLILQIPFAFAIFQGSYLIQRAFVPPNPDPKHVTKADRLANPAYLRWLSLYGKLLGFIGILHGLFSLLQGNPVQHLRPQTQINKHNPELFTWSLQSTALITTFLFGGYLRLLAYKSLRTNFTFGLAKPSRLVQSGIYAYIQHPSYTGAILLLYGFSALVMRNGGVLTSLTANWVLTFAAGCLNYGNALYLVLAVVSTFPMRIRREEGILREAFGEEWEGYHARTARFIPWVI